MGPIQELLAVLSRAREGSRVQDAMPLRPDRPSRDHTTFPARDTRQIRRADLASACTDFLLDTQKRNPVISELYNATCKVEVMQVGPRTMLEQSSARVKARETAVGSLRCLGLGSSKLCLSDV